jgi:aminopeptidase N
MYARRAFPDFVGYSPKYLQKEFTTTGHDAHETSLIWWNYLSRGNGTGAFQWTEGLGDYAEILYDYRYNKPIPRNFQYFRKEYLKMDMETDVVFNKLKGNTSQNIVHGKYPWIMRVLHFAIGDSAFYQGTKNLFETYRFKTYSIDQMIACYEKAAGVSLNWWKTEWLERKGVPELSLEYNIEAVLDKFVVNGKVVQKGAIYHIPIEIGIKTSDKINYQKVFLNGSETLFSFEYKLKPDSIIIDPNNWIIKLESY